MVCLCVCVFVCSPLHNDLAGDEPPSAPSVGPCSQCKGDALSYRFREPGGLCFDRSLVVIGIVGWRRHFFCFLDPVFKVVVIFFVPGFQDFELMSALFLLFLFFSLFFLNGT